MAICALACTNPPPVHAVHSSTVSFCCCIHLPCCCTARRISVSPRGLRSLTLRPPRRRWGLSVSMTCTARSPLTILLTTSGGHLRCILRVCLLMALRRVPMRVDHLLCRSGLTRRWRCVRRGICLPRRLMVVAGLRGFLRVCLCQASSESRIHASTSRASTFSSCTTRRDLAAFAHKVSISSVVTPPHTRSVIC